MRLLGLLCLLLVACGEGESPVRRDARRTVAAFDAVMRAPPDARSSSVEALRALPLVDRSAKRARQACLRMFDALERASSLQRRLEPMASELEGFADAGVDVPAPLRANVLRLFAEASRSTDEAEAALEPCTHAIDRLRTRTIDTR